jgi:hypothetical protein
MEESLASTPLGPFDFTFGCYSLPYNMKIFSQFKNYTCYHYMPYIKALVDIFILVQALSHFGKFN